MELMEIYEKSRVCPPEAKRTIQAGKLKGKTDINPMWRIKHLTELFGPCGIGWKIENETFWTTPGANGEVVAWCSLQLRYTCDKNSDCWSDPVFGIGGSMLVDTQKGNLTSNDEAYKMAYTDAISVACKALGFAADVYWEKDSTKYGRNEQRDPAPPAKPAIPDMAPCTCEECGKVIRDAKNRAGKIWPAKDIAVWSKLKYKRQLCLTCANKEQNNENAG